jgi:hypothetical protein
MLHLHATKARINMGNARAANREDSGDKLIAPFPLSLSLSGQPATWIMPIPLLLQALCGGADAHLWLRHDIHSEKI